MDTKNYNEVIALSEIISNAQDIKTLNDIYIQIGDYKHPQILYDLGVGFFVLGNKSHAKQLLIKGAEYGLTFNPEFYDNMFSNSIGQCFSVLLQEYDVYDFKLAINATSLGYAYLSKCIELYYHNAHDSYRSRGLLFKQLKDPTIILKVIIDNVGLGINTEPFIISDYYYAAMSSSSPFIYLLNSANEIHQNLEDIVIGGKNANDYSLKEIVQLGEERHKILFKTMEPKFKNGEFNLTRSQLLTLFR